MQTFETDSLEETYALGGKLSGRFDVGDCVGLIGTLGAGKTALVRGLARGLDLPDERMVSSPTYVLVHEYPGRCPIYHVDLYRLSSPEIELGDLGLEEMLSDGLVIIEWADRAREQLPRPRWEIDIEITGVSSRRFTLREVE
jgi:tRNA threonylcarbamoyladenosine biosynthesis protein TsaE